MGMKCDRALNGINALEIIEARLNETTCDFCRSYKIIFMDCEMPFMNGIQCVEKIRTTHQEYITLPIVAATAHNEEDIDINETYFDGLIIKPISASNLRMALFQYLKYIRDLNVAPCTCKVEVNNSDEKSSKNEIVVKSPKRKQDSASKNANASVKSKNMNRKK